RDRSRRLRDLERRSVRHPSERFHAQLERPGPRVRAKRRWQRPRTAGRELQCHLRLSRGLARRDDRGAVTPVPGRRRPNALGERIAAPRAMTECPSLATRLNPAPLWLPWNAGGPEVPPPADPPGPGRPGPEVPAVDPPTPDPGRRDPPAPHAPPEA